MSGHRNDSTWHPRYRVEKRDDPDGKHDACEFFVLDLTHDPHAVFALRAYAAAIQQTNPEFAAEIKRRWPSSGVSSRVPLAPDFRSERRSYEVAYDGRAGKYVNVQVTEVVVYEGDDYDDAVRNCEALTDGYEPEPGLPGFDWLRWNPHIADKGGL